MRRGPGPRPESTGRRRWRPTSTRPAGPAACKRAKRLLRRARLYETATKRIKTYGAGVVYAAVGFGCARRHHGRPVKYGHRLVMGGTVPRLRGKAKGPIAQGGQPRF